uniref:Uncharacterized protein n=1 Tax=Anguilla anguilla TaxID=7936 RepID=A0A0E9WYM5_ANGAN
MHTHTHTILVRRFATTILVRNCTWKSVSLISDLVLFMREATVE